MHAQNKRAEIDFFNMPDEYWPKFSNKTYQNLFGNYLATIKRGMVLDAGCGNGVFGAHLAKAGFDVVGVDISTCMLKAAKNITHASGFSIEFIRCDLEHLPFKENTFDACVCGAILHHFPILDKVVQEISSVLRYRGKLLVFEPNGSNPFARILNDFRSPLARARKSTTINETAHALDEYRKVFQANKFEKFMVQTTDALYNSALFTSKGKLRRRLVSHAFFHLFFPTLGVFLPKIRQGFYIIIHSERSSKDKATLNSPKQQNTRAL